MVVRYGVIGCGRQAPKHIAGLAARGDVEVFVADIDPARAQALARSHKVAGVRQVAELIDDPDIVAVSICTPPASHQQLILDVIGAGKSFLCEKPLTTTLAQARSLQAAASVAGVVGMVGYIYRFAPAYALAARALAGAEQNGSSAALGKISQATFRIGGPGSHDVWQHRLDSDGGAINEMLVHMIDLVLWLLGPVQDVALVVSDVRQKHRVIGGATIEADAEDWVLVRLTTRTGVEVLIQADLATPVFMQYAEIHGDNGSFFGSIQSEMPTFVQCHAARAGFTAGRNVEVFEPQNLFVSQMGLFLDCVLNGRALDTCTLANSVQLMETIEKLRNVASPE